VRQRTSTTPPVIDARDVLKEPRRILGLLCDALGVEFNQAMLAWPPGLRNTDGIWAKYWYHEVENSTSFHATGPNRTRCPNRFMQCFPSVPISTRNSTGIESVDVSGNQTMLQMFHERNRDLIVNINGALLHRDQAGVSPFDSAVQGGDAVWEGLRLYNGRIFKLNEHLDRLRSSALALAFTEIRRMKRSPKKS